jgi:mannosyl-oligosaccharide glucosidase
VSGLVETDIVFESGIYSAAMSISGDHFTTVLGGKFREFDRKFEEAFHLKHKGFELSVINMAQRSLSNLLGSLSYTYNTIKVESSDPIESFSAPFFGINSNGTSSFSTNCYCLLVLIHWDINLAKEILGRWFDLTNYNGWIPEVWSFDTDNILKHEVIHSASSPPVALLTIDQLIDKMITTNTMDLAYLNRLFPRVEAWIEWLYHIHKGSIEGAFRWQINDYIPHGHKDVPGGTHFTEDDRHLDLRCWMAQGFRVLLRMANLTQSELFLI